MGIIREMDYRYESSNPTITNNLKIDEAITQAFINKKRNNIDQFIEWASMSKEKDKIMPILNEYNNKLVNENSNVKTA